MEITPTIISIQQIRNKTTITQLQTQNNRNKKYTLKFPQQLQIATKKTLAESIRISSEWVVPGDLIDMTGFRGTMSCDVVLLNGKCVVNECMLTGSLALFKS